MADTIIVTHATLDPAACSSRRRRFCRLAAMTTALVLAGAASSAPLHAEDKASQTPLARTAEGWVRGTRSGAVERFLGIPFAEPPTEELRFRPPIPHRAWQGEREATQLKDRCAQVGGGSAEDCLYLNVYRPAHPHHRGRLPVLVWIHGGAMISGYAGDYDPSRFVEMTGSVVVTISYRLTVFGFLALPALTDESADRSSGNMGLQDQQLAMRWVRRNIHFFGGDAENITLAGQSAGAYSVCSHLTSPTALGLFSRAIMQSGDCSSISLTSAEQQGTAFAERVGCSDPTTAAACLREKPVAELLNASGDFSAAPVVGGMMLPIDPRFAVSHGVHHRVPVLIGDTRDEFRAFAGYLGIPFPLPEPAYPALIASSFGQAQLGPIVSYYTPSNYSDPYYAWTAANSDSGLQGIGNCSTLALAADFASTTPTYMYEFDDPKAPTPTWVTLPSGFELGSSHSSELAYLFDPALLAKEPLTPAQEQLSDEMIRYWGAFMRRGDPNVPGAPEWPRFVQNCQSVLRLAPNQTSTISNFTTIHHCDFWRTVGPTDGNRR